MQIISFGSDDIENKIANMTAAQLDQLPFGVVKIDAAGVVIHYNDAEGRIVRRDPKQQIGRNFFTEVAPCTNMLGFRDRFDQGVRDGILNVVFEWQFQTPGLPMVQIHMKKAVEPGQYWLFVKRL